MATPEPIHSGLVAEGEDGRRSARLVDGRLWLVWARIAFTATSVTPEAVEVAEQAEAALDAGGWAW